MPIQSAIDLIGEIDSSVDLRMEIYSCQSTSEVEQCLARNGYLFNANELQDAINSLHVKCQTLGEAQDLMHKAEWLKYILLQD